MIRQEGRDDFIRRKDYREMDKDHEEIISQARRKPKEKGKKKEKEKERTKAAERDREAKRRKGRKEKRE